MIQLDQIILSEPSIVIIWTYMDMMEWMSRMLVGEKASAHVDFGLGSWANVMADFLLKHKHTNPNPTQHDPHGPDDSFRTISNCHHLDISRHDEMNEKNVGWKKG
jgi:hypothetical protein